MIRSVTILFCYLVSLNCNVDGISCIRPAGNIDFTNGTLSARITGKIRIVLAWDKLHFGGRVELSGPFSIIPDNEEEPMKCKQGILKGGRINGDFNNLTRPWKIAGTLTGPIKFSSSQKFKTKQLYIENIPVTGAILASPKSKTILGPYGDYRYMTKVDVELMVENAPFTLEEKGQTHCGIPNDQNLNRRIANGEEAQIHKYPWAVYIVHLFKYIVGDCGGTLLSPDRVLTAAHCVMKPLSRSNPKLGKHVDKVDSAGNFVVYLGAHDVLLDNMEQIEPLWEAHIGSNVGVKKIEMFPHESFSTMEVVNCSTVVGTKMNPIWWHHDIAMLFLKKRVTLDFFQDIICLPDQLPTGTTYHEVVSVGWGDQRDNKPPGYLKVANFRLILPSEVQCIQNNGAQFDFDQWMLTSNYMHDQDNAHCNGDSGSPVFIKNGDKYFLVGVIQGSNSEDDLEDVCEPPEVQYKVRVETEAHLKWIKQHL